VLDRQRGIASTRQTARPQRREANQPETTAEMKAGDYEVRRCPRQVVGRRRPAAAPRNGGRSAAFLSGLSYELVAISSCDCKCVMASVRVSSGCGVGGGGGIVTAGHHTTQSEASVRDLPLIAKPPRRGGRNWTSVRPAYAAMRTPGRSGSTRASLGGFCRMYKSPGAHHSCLRHSAPFKNCVTRESRVRTLKPDLQAFFTGPRRLTGAPA
jgi:hypothetical protein